MNIFASCSVVSLLPSNTSCSMFYHTHTHTHILLIAFDNPTCTLPPASILSLSTILMSCERFPCHICHKYTLLPPAFYLRSISASLLFQLSHTHLLSLSTILMSFMPCFSATSAIHCFHQPFLCFVFYSTCPCLVLHFCCLTHLPPKSS